MVSNFFQEERLSWAKLIGVCTDGAPSMLGSKSGFATLVKKKNPDVITTHCLIHREALASKTLPAALKVTLETDFRIVNHIKGHLAKKAAVTQSSQVPPGLAILNVII